MGGNKSWWKRLFGYEGSEPLDPPQKKAEPTPEEKQDRHIRHAMSAVITILAAALIGLIAYVLKNDTKSNTGRDGPGFFDPNNPWKPGDGPIGWEPGRNLPPDWEPPTWPLPGNPPPNWPWPDNAELANSFELSSEQVHQLQLLSDYGCDSDFGVMEGADGTFHTWGTEEWVVAGAALFLLVAALYKITEWMKSSASQSSETLTYSNTNRLSADSLEGANTTGYVPGTEPTTRPGL
jgi:hypothetical protein